MEVISNKQLMEMKRERGICPVCGTECIMDVEFVQTSDMETRWVAEGCIDEEGFIGFKLPNPSDILRVDIIEFYCPNCDYMYDVYKSWFPTNAREE